MPEQIVFDVLTGDLPKKERERVITKLNSGQCKTLVATIHLVGEGVDIPPLALNTQKGRGQIPIYRRMIQVALSRQVGSSAEKWHFTSLGICLCPGKSWQINSSHF